MAIEAFSGERERMPGKERLFAAPAFRPVGQAFFRHPVRRLAMRADQIHTNVDAGFPD
jgi:hypothetical protein